MYNDQLENLINLALADGELTEKEKQVLFKKAESLGIDTDEFEMVLDARLHQLKSNTSTTQSKPSVTKCPNCGDVINGLSKVCPSCNYIFSKSTDTTSLEKAIDTLEDSIVVLKSFPKPNYYKVIKSIFLIYITAGFYILYKKIYKKEHIFSTSNGNEFEVILAQSEKQIRVIKTNYGENSKVKKLIEELKNERDSIVKQRNKTRFQATLITVSILVALIIIGILQPKPIEQKIEQLIEEGKIEEAKTEVSKLKSTNYHKEGLEEKISDLEIDKLIEESKYDEALQRASMISSEYKRNNETEKIVKKVVDELLQKKDFKLAKQKAQLIKTEYTRKEIENKIDNAKNINK